MFNNIVLVVIDGLGIGALPDAYKYGDEGSNTLKNISNEIEDFYLPNFKEMGLGNVLDIDGMEKTRYPLASYGKMLEQSPGKDTTSGHWELTGNILNHPFPTYPDGFPRVIIDEFVKRGGRNVLGNKAASGTEIIKELGEKHIKTGDLIVYTSADSVFQIAAHEEVVPPGELYDLCEIAREILTGEHSVGRVIARPFRGFSPEDFWRTDRRRDFSLKPPENNLLSLIKNSGKEVIGVGKIEDIFAGEGITRSLEIKDNTEGIEKTIDAVNEIEKGLVITNLIDTDMLYGHRNDITGFFNALFEFDLNLPQILTALAEDDMLIITSDHGCDPTLPGTDHTREYVPLLVYSPKLISPKNLGTRATFADIGQTVAEVLEVSPTEDGTSFFKELLNMNNG